ncbi:hypothetical protein VE01_03652 [Pseudogymnoascus verrucosus]|uniref:Autophagy-related protein 6 n=1 Tax=Pseudogymnoascus verrucosus TaxID=342668 RepID=A0A1B8GS57_9PEZI|nr:uncharacterized protein VE01_03652 [Pseudogymnoascus verrucosus]OBT98655.1 hypothetical protein VE01_03652 [Pseudogymnoascus verrucosus]
MGWFWGATADDKKSSTDPLRDLDPSLQAFLKKESPVQYSPTTPPPTQPQAQQQPTEPTSTTSSSEPPADPAAPPTLFKDNRYAHLWKTYTPQSAIEAATKSDSEKIADVLEGYKYRKAEIGRAALENCALEQWEVNECFSNGGVKARLTMCRTENKSLERCVEMQQKFLKALGYLSTFDRGKDVDERIQMHADTLYHRMLAQEKAVQEAEKEGKEMPKFEPLLGKGGSSVTAITPAEAAAAKEQVPEIPKTSPLSKLPLDIQAQIKEKLEGLTGIERELQEKALAAEVSAGQEVKANLKDIYKDSNAERQKRVEEGNETIVDRVSSILGGWK